MLYVPRIDTMIDKKISAKRTIDDIEILHVLRNYQPEVVSTIFADLDIESSDIDIVCCHSNVQEFEAVYSSAFSLMQSYEFWIREDCIIGRFCYGGFVVEVYSSTTPVQLQAGYRHFQMMKRLSKFGGKSFSDQVRALKLSGLKTEAAICRVLSLPGDPYKAVLDLEIWSEKELANYVREHI